jgi:hypothetical protein
LKEFGLKGSLSIEHYSVLNLNIRSGTLDLIGEFNREERGRVDMLNRGLQEGAIPHSYREVDYVCLAGIFSIKGGSHKVNEFLERAANILNKGNYDNSDVMRDYFDVGFYVRINVGSYSQPYQLMTERALL